MELEMVLRTRKSVRTLNDRKISRDVVVEILDAARFAPSVHNAQPGYFIILDENLDDIWDIVEVNSPQGAWTKVRNAQILVAVCLDIPESEEDEKELEAYFQSAGALIQNILLAAHNKNIGTCWLGGNTQRGEEKLKEYLNIPAYQRLITLISFGYYDADKAIGKSKKELDEILYINKYGRKN